MSTLFVISEGPDQGARFEFDLERLGIGRDSSNTIRLHDTEVSRRHAELRRDGSSYWLVDLGSANGTYVNGRPIRSAEISAGDTIQVGRTVMVFGAPEASSELAERIRMISQQEADDASNIVKSISHGEGSRYLARPHEAGSPWLTRALGNLEVMFQTAREVSHTLDLDQLLASIMRLVFRSVDADRGCVLLRDEATGEFLPRAVHFRDNINSTETIAISRTILDHVLRTSEGVLTSDAPKDFSPAQSILQFGIREAICVPMQGRHDLVGLMYVDVTTPPQRALGPAQQRFTEDHLKLLIAIALVAAMAVEDTRYYRAMVQAERLAAVGQTIATLSHHIKNILQGIRGGSYLIDMGLNNHDEAVVRRGWDIVERNQAKIYNLVMDMLTFSKEREPALEEADLNHVVAEVVELMQTRARDLGAKLEYLPAAEMPRVTFDPEGIHRAVLNVVTNALDAVAETPEAKVVVRTEHCGTEQKIRVVVEDNGVGIPPEQIGQIFMLFASNKGARGTGLGLPVSQKIVQEHGGTICVDSTPGQGSRFTIELPVAQPQPAPSENGLAAVSSDGQSLRMPGVEPSDPPKATS
ncbi:MAG: FHA domain-containing protein [Planctomycetes bacterium]|nr:FHA domain-containing protein [Planctomycetota bacterium]